MPDRSPNGPRPTDPDKTKELKRLIKGFIRSQAFSDDNPLTDAQERDLTAGIIFLATGLEKYSHTADPDERSKLRTHVVSSLIIDMKVQKGWGTALTGVWGMVSRLPDDAVDDLWDNISEAMGRNVG